MPETIQEHHRWGNYIKFNQPTTNREKIVKDFTVWNIRASTKWLRLTEVKTQTKVSLAYFRINIF